MKKVSVINKKQFGAETKALKKLYKKYGRVNEKMQTELYKRGYYPTDLGTTSRVKTYSGDIGYKPASRYGDKDLWGIGISNIGRGKYTIYRAFVKKVRHSDELYK